MSDYTKEEALAFVEAIRLSLAGRTGFKWLVERLSSLAGYIESTSADNERLNAYIDSSGARADFESYREQEPRTGSAAPMKLDTDTEKYLLESIRRFFAEEMDSDIGDLKALRVLDYIVEEIGPSIYNQAIADAQTYFAEKTSDLAGVRFEPEFDFWKKR
jgi:uncharacterized protein (DUF2164 family)